MKLCVALVALSLSVGTASGQVVMGGSRPPGVRTNLSPPKREPPPVTSGPVAPPSSSDLFRAGPDTYRPHPDPPYFFPPTVFDPGYSAPEVILQPVIVERTIVVERPPEKRQDATVAPPVVPPTPVIVGVKKTVYVIPRCYAGDKPPDASRLAPGCDIRDVKIIPPH